MSSKTTKTVKIPASKADEWDRYVDENPEIDSVSHLIRLAVEKEMSGKYDLERRRSDDGDGAGVSGEVLTALNNIQTAIEDVEDRLTALEDTTEEEVNYDLRRAVFDALPPFPEDETLEQAKYDADGELIGREDSVLPSEYGATPQELAEQLGAETGEVEGALDQLEDATAQVMSETTAEGTYYGKRTN